MRSYWNFLIVLAGAAATAAEPPIDPARDLPRVPPTEPSRVQESFQVKPGFEMQLVAAEPLVVDPVAFDFDEEGRLFVAEMRDYSERRDEKAGRIRVLEDTDGDGVFDKSWVYAEGLPWPTAVICFDGGVFVGATPDLLYFKDGDGDHRAEIKRTVFTGFAKDSLKRLNVQALMNSFRWGVDQRIHGSASVSGGTITSPENPAMKAVELRGKDFSFDPRTLEFRPETGGGQHGMSFDDGGAKFLCSNSDHIQSVLVEERYLQAGAFTEFPAVRESIAADGPAAEVYRISPDEPWRVIRTRWRVTGAVPGMIEGGGRPSGYFTGATGATIYRGDALPPEYVGDAFVADCGSNLIHHKKLRQKGYGLLAERPQDELHSEFVASRDNWFRPVQFGNGPDGALYVADMYRETIEHPWSLPDSIKKHLDLNSGNDRGRIYRIVPKGFKPRAQPHLRGATGVDLVALLDSANGWTRDTASRLLYERRDEAVRPRLAEKVRKGVADLGRMHALRVLESVDGLDADVVAAALHDRSPLVRRHALQVTETLSQQGKASADLWNAVRGLAEDTDPRVILQLAWTLNRVKATGEREILLGVMKKHEPEPRLRIPVIAALAESASSVVSEELTRAKATAGLEPWLGPLLRAVGMRGNTSELQRIVEAFKPIPPGRRSLELLLELAVGLGQKGISLVQWDASRQLSTHYEYIQTRARAGAGVSGQGLMEEQALALRLVGAMDVPGSAELIADVLNRKAPAEVQRSALQAVSRLGHSSFGGILVSAWPKLEASLHGEVLSLLLRRPAWQSDLVGAIEAGRIPRGEITREQVQQLRNLSDSGLRRRAEALFGAASTESRQGVVNRFLPALALRGDKAKGSLLYEQRCMVCHRMGGRGAAVGPDLESVRSMGKDKLLTQIVDPNREVAPNYLSQEIETREGETLTGLIVFESEETLRLKMSGAQELTLKRSQILKQKARGISLMPEGLVDDLSLESMADLLEFVNPSSR